jgi:hypothetical protein
LHAEETAEEAKERLREAFAVTTHGVADALRATCVRCYDFLQLAKISDWQFL